MTKKVILNTYVSPELRQYIKITAAQKGLTMAALFERIIVEWQKSNGIENNDTI